MRKIQAANAACFFFTKYGIIYSAKMPTIVTLVKLRKRGDTKHYGKNDTI